MVDEIIETKTYQHGWVAKADCEDRSKIALDKNPAFFQDPAHQDKIATVKDLVSDFFSENKGIYINHRIGTKKSGPFSVVKVDKPMFPNMKPDAKKAKFYDPLEQLGVTIVFNKATSGYLFHIK